ncbi:MAG: hypothetical protein KBD55_00500 [Candidatus Pacebacteria bacterium]|nr:hypothetical protein [Candidatus Paceibacterota bacterium]
MITTVEVNSLSMKLLVSLMMKYGFLPSKITPVSLPENQKFLTEIARADEFLVERPPYLILKEGETILRIFSDPNPNDVVYISQVLSRERMVVPPSRSFDGIRRIHGPRAIMLTNEIKRG